MKCRKALEVLSQGITEEQSHYVSIGCHEILCLIIVGCIAMVGHFETTLH